MSTQANVLAQLGSAGVSQGFKNRIINGAMVIDQRNAGASVTPADSQYTLDRWQAFLTQASKFTTQQNAGSVTPPTGFNYYAGITSSSAYSITSSDYFGIQQHIEYANTMDLGWGTANAKTITLSFWVRSSLTGTFGGALANYGRTRAYPFTYTISSANTWEKKSVIIAGDTSGTWGGAVNTGGITLGFGLGVGSTYSAAAGAWAAGLYLSATGATSVVGTNGATFYITGVQLEVGTSATEFEVRPYGTELALCQRYYQKWKAQNAYTYYPIFGIGSSTTTVDGVLTYIQEMRSTPTFEVSTLQISDTSGSYAVTDAAILYAGLSSARVDFTIGTASLTTYRAYQVRAANNSASYVAVNAEL